MKRLLGTLLLGLALLTQAGCDERQFGFSFLRDSLGLFGSDWYAPGYDTTYVSTPVYASDYYTTDEYWYEDTTYTQDWYVDDGYYYP